MTRIAALVIALSFCTPALAEEPFEATALVVEGVSFPQTFSSEDTPLELRNAALLRYRVVFKAYVAGLYLPADVAPDRVLDADVPRRLEIEYLWAIKADDFRKVTDRGIERGVEPAAYQALLPQIERLNDLYRDVEPGDRYAITYLPGTGTELSLNDEPLGVVEGEEFAAALFGIWLGEEPLDRKLKNRLLEP